MRILLFIIISSFSCFQILRAQESMETISQDLLLSVRYEEPYEPFERQLQEVSLDELTQSLTTENSKKAFWLNIYNAYIQIKAKQNPALLAGKRNHFFGKKWITIAGIRLSFDDIEHGILRHSQWKLGKGYITCWFPSKIEKKLRLDTVDYRIHFALNCGAKSCPPIAYYHSDKIHQQLDEATIGFLKSTSIIDTTEKKITVSKLFSWFSGDFGGEKGVYKIMLSKGIIPHETTFKILYADYDWTLDLKNYVK